MDILVQIAYCMCSVMSEYLMVVAGYYYIIIYFDIDFIDAPLARQSRFGCYWWEMGFSDDNGYDNYVLTIVVYSIYISEHI